MLGFYFDKQLFRSRSFRQLNLNINTLDWLRPNVSFCGSTIVSTNSLVNFLFLQFLFGHRYFFFGCRLIFLRRILFFRLIRSLSFVVFAFFLCFHLIGFFHFFYCIPSSLEFCSFWRELFFVLILVLFEKLVYLTIMIWFLTSDSAN